METSQTQMCFYGPWFLSAAHLKVHLQVQLQMYAKTLVSAVVSAVANALTTVILSCKTQKNEAPSVATYSQRLVNKRFPFICVHTCDNRLRSFATINFHFRIAAAISKSF